MAFLQDLPIRYKITLMLVAVVSIVLVATSAANVYSEVSSNSLSMRAKYSALANIVAAQSGAALSIADIDKSSAQQILTDLAVEPSIQFAALYNPAGHEVARYPVGSNFVPAIPLHNNVLFTPDGFLDVAQQVHLSDGTPVGKLFLRADTTELRDQIFRTVWIAAVVFGMALALALLLSWTLQRVISRPIQELAKLSKLVSTGHDYTLVASKYGNDELGALSDDFNNMLAQIRRRDEELEAHRQRLEADVRERTLSLEQRTEALTATNAELTRSREELEAANKELEAFSYSVSHDLRAPLRAIDGFSRILMQDYHAVLPADAQDYLQEVRNSTQRMGQLVDDLLAFSRLSRQTLKLQTVQTRRMVDQCLEELQGDWADRKVEFNIGELTDCQADPGLLKQVWVNLLSNAVKYSSRVTQATIEVGSRPGENPKETVYFVKDNGVGFDMRYVHKLFGVFQRLHRAEDFPGTGVGLAICHRIISRHGGRIWADSAPNQGTTMSFALPHGEPEHV